MLRKTTILMLALVFTSVNVVASQKTMLVPFVVEADVAYALDPSLQAQFDNIMSKRDVINTSLQIKYQKLEKLARDSEDKALSEEGKQELRKQIEADTRELQEYQDMSNQQISQAYSHYSSLYTIAKISAQTYIDQVSRSLGYDQVFWDTGFASLNLEEENTKKYNITSKVIQLINKTLLATNVSPAEAEAEEGKKLKIKGK